MISNYAELMEEKVRLKEKTLIQEASFKANLESVKERFWPVRTFLKNTTETLNSGKGEISLLRHTLQVGVPLIIDRFLLGTKGLIAKQAVTWVSRAALKKLSGKIPPKFEARAGAVINTIQNNELLAGLIKVFGKKLLKKSRNS